MGTQPPILLGYTLDDEEATTLTNVLQSTLGDVSVDYRPTPAGTRSAIESAEILVTFGLTDELLERAQSLEWIQALSAGVDSYDVATIESREIVLTSASGVHAQPAAEQAIGYMLAFERNFPAAFSNQQRGVFERYAVGELHGSTVGIVGLGAIGRRVAELATPFGVETIGLKRDLSTGGDVVDELVGPEDLESLLVRSDHVVLCCPLTEQTRKMIDTQALRTMNDDAVLINVGRGGLVDEPALERALQRDWIGGAALDVTATEPLPGDSVLWKLSNVLLTPHTAGATPAYMDRCASIVAKNYRAYVDGDLTGLTNRIV